MSVLKKPPTIHFPKWRHQLRRVWNNRLVRDERGFAAVIVALFAAAIMASLAFLVDISGLLIARQRAQTMADFGVAAGGRVVVEQIVVFATDEAVGKEILPEDADHPERYLTTSTRQFLQTDGAFVTRVVRTVEDYILENKPEGWKNFSTASDMTISYPEKILDCTDEEERFVNVAATVNYQYPFIFGGLLKALRGTDTLPVTAESYYRIQLCR